MKTITTNSQENLKMQVKVNSRLLLVWILIFLQVFLSIGALFGGGAFILALEAIRVQVAGIPACRCFVKAQLAVLGTICAIVIIGVH